MSITLIVFAKAPVAGQAKTRLAPALGPEGAAALALRLLEHSLAQAAEAAQALEATLELCVTPDTHHPAFARLAAAHRLRLRTQGPGDLGERMDRALQRALGMTEGALLIGTDAPALDAPCLQAAALALTNHDAVFVPALDGGYALVGLRTAAPALFEGMTWSHAAVMQETRQRAAQTGLTWAELPAVADIDDPADLELLPAAWRKDFPYAAPAHPCPT